MCTARYVAQLQTIRLFDLENSSIFTCGDGLLTPVRRPRRDLNPGRSIDNAS